MDAKFGDEAPQDPDRSVGQTCKLPLSKEPASYGFVNEFGSASSGHSGYSRFLGISWYLAVLGIDGSPRNEKLNDQALLICYESPRKSFIANSLLSEICLRMFPPPGRHPSPVPLSSSSMRTAAIGKFRCETVIRHQNDSRKQAT